jgi:hypothetical protein
MSLLNRAKSVQFNDDLVDEIVANKNDKIALVALSRIDCPSSLLVDLSQSTNKEVRLAVASHANTPNETRKRMAKDPENNIAYVARSRVK